MLLLELHNEEASCNNYSMDQWGLVPNPHWCIYSWSKLLWIQALWFSTNSWKFWLSHWWDDHRQVQYSILVEFNPYERYMGLHMQCFLLWLLRDEGSILHYCNTSLLSFLWLFQSYFHVAFNIVPTPNKVLKLGLSHKNSLISC